MLVQRLLSVFVASIAVVSSTPLTPQITPRQDSDADSIVITSHWLSIFMHSRIEGEENGASPPFAQYQTTILYGELWGSCYHLDYYPDDYADGKDCDPSIPDPASFKAEGCPPPGDFDGLQGATWSLTRYGDRYVQQFNVPDQSNPDKVYVACYEFNKSAFECYPGSNYQFVAPNETPDDNNLTATVGKVCPTY